MAVDAETAYLHLLIKAYEGTDYEIRSLIAGYETGHLTSDGKEMLLDELEEALGIE